MAPAEKLIPCEPYTVVRPLERGDINFVLSTWLRSHRSSPRGKQFRKSRDYYKHQRPFVESLVRNAQVLVAADIEEPHVIYGWCCFEPEALHYIYVKRETFRGRFGVAALLHRESGLGPEFTITHRTEQGLEWLKQNNLTAGYYPIEEFYEQSKAHT